MRYISVGLFSFILLFVFAVNIVSAQTSECPRIIIPAYIYETNTAVWESAFSGSSAIDYMIVNQNEGPGTTYSAMFNSRLQRMRELGIEPLGYVDSNYTNVSISNVENVIEDWENMYGVTSVFIDQVTNGGQSTNLPYYQSIANYVMTQDSNATIVWNPGTFFTNTTNANAYLTLPGIFTIVENTYSNYSTMTMPSWVNSFDANRFYHLIYNTSSEQLTDVLSKARQSNAGYIYITNDNLPNPWDTIPNYFANEATQIMNGCVQAQTPTPSPISNINPGDVNGDSQVNLQDYSIVISNFGRMVVSRLMGDLDGNGRVDLFDFNQVVSHFGNINVTATPAVTNTPMPTSIPTLTPTSIPILTPTPENQTWWQPTADAPISFHWQLSQEFSVNRDYDPNIKVYDIDGFNNSAATVNALKQRGAVVICYIDVGGAEPYRDDFSLFPTDAVGNRMSGWNEYYVDIRRAEVRQIMVNRLQMCKDKGFDAIEPDVLDAYTANSGFPLTYQDQINYNRFLADAAHDMGMSIGLKGDTDQAMDLAPFFDWTLNEECAAYNECRQLNGFIDANKAVFQVEYSGAIVPGSNRCNSAIEGKRNAQKRELELGGPTSAGFVRQTCLPDSVTGWH